MLVIKNTGDRRVLFFHNHGTFSMVNQYFSKTIQEGYFLEAGSKKAGYWLTETPVKINFYSQLVQKLLEAFSKLFSQKIFHKPSISKNNRFAQFTPKLINSKNRLPYFSIPIAIPDLKSSVFYLGVSVSLTDSNEYKSYAIDQLTKHKLWSITKSDLFVFSDKNHIQYSLDTRTTSMMRGKVFTNPYLEKTLISSIKQQN